MKRKDLWKLILFALLVTAILSVIFVTITIMAPAKRTTKAVKYDLKCVAGRSRNPLVECKE
jgi:uncharacterized protein YpmS